MGRDADGESTNRNRNGTDKSRRETPIGRSEITEKKYPFKFVEKNNNKSLEGKFQNKTQTAKGGTESTVKTDTGRIISRKFISCPLFQTEKKIRREQLPLRSNKNQPKNRHCFPGLDGKYGCWDEILPDILNGKLKMVQNRKRQTGIRKKKMMTTTTTTKKCRRKPEDKLMLSPNATADTPRTKQIRRMMQYKLKPTQKYWVRKLKLKFCVQTEIYLNRIDTAAYIHRKVLVLKEINNK